MASFDAPPQEFDRSAAQAATVGTSERWRAAKLAESYYQSRQYDHLARWESDAPLHKRRPREIVPLYKTVVDAMQRFTWGGARFPRVVVGSTAAEGVDQSEVGPLVSDADARDLTTFAVNLVKQARLERCAGEFSRRAIITGSSAVVLGTRGGYLNYYVEPGYHCTPTFDPDCPRRVKALDIVYQYEREDRLPGGTFGKKLYWFRRRVDEIEDVVYRPVEVKPGVDPEWMRDPANSVEHALGFCPVVWARCFPLSPQALDGQPMVDPSLYGILDRISYVYSQRGRAIEYVLDPQWIRRNVTPDQREALQKNPGKIWDIADMSSDRPAEIKLVEADGTGSDASANHLKDLQARFLEATGVILSAMDKLSTRGNVSGVVLEYLHAPMIAVASELRKDLGDEAFIDVVQLAMRIVTTQTLAGKDVWVQGSRAAAKKIQKAQLDGEWLDLPVRLQWGRFFAPTAQDVSQAVTAAAQAKGLLVGETSATRFVADYFGVTDIDSEVDQLDDPTALDPATGKPLAGAKPALAAPPARKPAGPRQ